ncbi:uncharacterized protein [Dermacentor albipictus]|uniref:uncharacterized protein isoform X2 n=1 Tax=Dermacentor albipictus TaxID=60249 RepID=UPI0038FD1109
MTATPGNITSRIGVEGLVLYGWCWVTWASSHVVAFRRSRARAQQFLSGSELGRPRVIRTPEEQVAFDQQWREQNPERTGLRRGDAAARAQEQLHCSTKYAWHGRAGYLGQLECVERMFAQLFPRRTNANASLSLPFGCRFQLPSFAQASGQQRDFALHRRRSTAEPLSRGDVALGARRPSAPARPTPAALHRWTPRAHGPSAQRCWTLCLLDGDCWAAAASCCPRLANCARTPCDRGPGFLPGATLPPSAPFCSSAGQCGSLRVAPQWKSTSNHTPGWEDANTVPAWSDRSR